jgi:exodeoxyribonuclease V beta subunit
MSRSLVEASAGTGKTFHIERTVLGLVVGRGVPLDRILVVTFTRAAAAELRRRVRARLAAAADGLADGAAAPDEDLAALLAEHGVAIDEAVRRLAAALERFDDALIDTIHGFARRALAQAALDAGLDPGAELLEDVRPIVTEAAVDLAVEELRPASVPLHRFLVGHHGIDVPRLVALAAAVDGEPTLRIHPTLDALGLTGDDAPLPDRPIVDVLERLLERRTASLRAAWREEGERLWAWLAAEHAAKRLEKGIHTAGKGRDRHLRVGAWADGDAPLDAATLGDLAHFSGHRLRGRAAAPVDPTFAVCAAIDALDDLATAFLVHAAHRLRASVAARKRRLRVLGFADLLTALDGALGGDDGRRLRDAVRSRFDVALVDEFQDTDPVQWRIFDRLFPVDDRSGTLMMVGDPKQAIYAFRGADVDTYLEARATVTDDHDVLRLERNWRSDAALVAALNGLFDRPEDFGADGVFLDPGITYRPVTAARAEPPSRIRQPAGKSAAFGLEWVRRDAIDDAEPRDAADGSRELTLGWADRHLPRLVAEGIATVLAEGTTLLDDGAPDAGRRVEAGDVAVLVRTHRQAEAVHRALGQVGVPAVLRSEASVLHAPEAEELDRLLTAVLRPGSESALRAMLATTLIGSTARELVGLDEVALGRWHERVSAWARRWERDGIAAFVQEVLGDTGAPARLVASERGDRALTNLRHLTELLTTVELTRRASPEALHDWLRRGRLTAGTGSREHELRLESDAACVQVLTVHASKGLEYPIVWVPYLWHVRDGDGDDLLRLHDPDGGGLVLDVTVAPDHPDRRRRAERRALEDDREQMRLLYVALTRARHRVVAHAGVFARSDRSALRRLLLGVDTGTGGPWTGRSDDDIVTRLAAIAPNDVEVHEVTDVRPAPTSAGAAPSTSLVTHPARRPTRSVDRSWRRVSFTSLVRPLESGAASHDEPEAADHDAATAPPTVVDAADDGAELPLDGFPRGADAGEFLHRLLELVDLAALADASTAPAAVMAALAAVDARGGTGPRVRTALASSGAVARLTDGLRLAAATPLGPLASGRALGDLAPTDRLHELRFDLPIAGGEDERRRAVTTAAIADLLEAHADQDTAPLRALAARLRSAPTAARGLLTGSIDLVARVDGRYLIADFKSNRLGPVDGPARSSHYRRPGLARAMEEHDYLLQELLYLVALHRLLRWRLPDYDIDRHVAGGLYLFLRGMVGADPAGPDGVPAGVWSHRPATSLVLGLDALLAGVEP